MYICSSTFGLPPDKSGNAPSRRPQFVRLREHSLGVATAAELPDAVDVGTLEDVKVGTLVRLHPGRRTAMLRCHCFHCLMGLVSSTIVDCHRVTVVCLFSTPA